MSGRVSVVLLPLLLLAIWLVRRSRRPLELDSSRRGGVRSAALETRTVGGDLPRWLGGLVTASTIGLGALLVTTTLMGSADDMGRAGRSLFRMCSLDKAAGHGPWPGQFYSVPLGIAVVLGLLVAAVALRTVVLRARSGTAPDLVADDDVSRRSAEAVVAATGVMMATSLPGVSLAAGIALIGFPCPPTAWTILGIALLAVAILMLALAIWCLALLLSHPRSRAMMPTDSAAAGQAGRR